jgi:peptide-methionine (S)-S-oxide reductase
MKTIYFSSFSFLMILAFGCGNVSQTKVESVTAEVTATAEMSSKATLIDTEHLSKAYFASGCFWCVEAIFESVKGVEEAISGYAGGDEQNPTYKQVSRGATGHTESVEVLYDPEVIDYKTLLDVFYASHNPTTVNGQAPDFGKQYRSAIFYTNDQEKQMAIAYKDSLEKSGIYKEPIATEISPLKTFWKAESYHQDYEKNNPDNSYIRNVSIPRLNRFKAKLPELLKKEIDH